MNVILLSGGSGKRLWPLSNDVVSKQFLKLFKTEDGFYESMLQRVFRQINSVDNNARITIATSKTQVPLIREQLGEKVSVSVEPSRRNTFPAIALAILYLHDKLGVDREEPIIVCPVDSYVDNSFFASFKVISGLIEENRSKLILMGCEPTFPSEQYGYIIPQDKNLISAVKEFKEKPEQKVAEGYIREGALWNAGVFGFKLGYLFDVLQVTTGFSCYDDLYNNYEKCSKISFDYAVVEKELSIQVLRYEGKWKDIGSWNTLTDVIGEEKIGNVVTSGCTDTKIINNLGVPLLCLDCHDLVVVASESGILITSKKESCSIKEYMIESDDLKNKR